MNISFKLLLTTFILTLTLTGCGSDSDSDSDSNDPVNENGNGSPSNNDTNDLEDGEPTVLDPTLEIQGTWKKDCLFNVEDNTYSIKQEVFDGGEFSSTLIISHDADCASPTYTSRSTGVIQFGQRIVLSSGITVKAIDSLSFQYFLTPLSDIAANTYNTAQYCEHSNWEVGVELEITSCFMPEPGEILEIFSIYKIEGEQLFVGDIEANENFDGSTPDKRPTQLEDTFYTKQ